MAQPGANIFRIIYIIDLHRFIRGFSQIKKNIFSLIEERFSQIKKDNQPEK